MPFSFLEIPKRVQKSSKVLQRKRLKVDALLTKETELVLSEMRCVIHEIERDIRLPPRDEEFGLVGERFYPPPNVAESIGEEEVGTVLTIEHEVSLLKCVDDA